MRKLSFSFSFSSSNSSLDLLNFSSLPGRLVLLESMSDQLSHTGLADCERLFVHCYWSAFSDSSHLRWIVWLLFFLFFYYSIQHFDSDTNFLNLFISTIHRRNRFHKHLWEKLLIILLLIVMVILVMFSFAWFIAGNYITM